MKNTGVFASPRETAQARRFVELSRSQPGELTRLFKNREDRPFDIDFELAPHQTDQAIIEGLCHGFALAHGLPQIEGSYGMSMEGEFQAPDEKEGT